MPLHDDKRKEYFVSAIPAECDQWINEQPHPERFEAVRQQISAVASLWSVYKRRRTVDRTIRKPLTRFTKQLFQRRQIAVTIGPGDVISFRMKGCRKVTTVPIEKLYRTAIWWEASAIANQKRADRAQKKKVHRR